VRVRHEIGCISIEKEYIKFGIKLAEPASRQKIRRMCLASERVHSRMDDERKDATARNAIWSVCEKAELDGNEIQSKMSVSK
jgi:hypothetical protein